MIEEDYVSFETAKLLKEKGFDEPCTYLWFFEKTNNPEVDDNGVYKIPIKNHTENDYWNNTSIELFKKESEYWNDNIDIFACPTLQMAMKWLREVHNIHIELNPICYGDTEEDIKWHYGWAVKTTIFIDRWKRHNAKHISYEQACEAAIKYCLENLI